MSAGTYPVWSVDIGGTTYAFPLARLKYDATVAPTVSDDAAAGFQVGSSWTGPTLGAIYGLIDSSIGAAVWILLGSTGGGGIGSESAYSAQNKDAGTIANGMACSVHTSGTGVVKASAADASQPACGLALVGAATTFAVTVQTEGLMQMADWSGVTDEASTTLSAHALYFLSPTTPGNITITPPTTVGQVVQRIGRAVATDTLEISIDDAILL